MKQVILGLAFVAVGMCTIGKRTDEYYNKGSSVFGGEPTITGHGGSLTGVGKKLGGSHHKGVGGGSLARSSMNPVASSSDELTFNVKIDKDEIENIAEDFEDFGERYWTQTSRERNVLLKKLTEAFRNTAAKMILNFGKTIPPVVQSWAEVMRHVQVNPKCD